MDDPEEDYEFEASLDNTYEIDVHLLNGTCRENYSISLDKSVQEEKERIWNSEGQGALLELNANYVVLVLEGNHGEKKLMEDDRLVEYYLHDLAVSTVRFVRRRHNANILLTQVKKGDLLEFPRKKLGYSHWAVYVGDGYVIHLAGEYWQGKEKTSIDIEVRKELFEVVALDSKAKINNYLDEVERILPVEEIVRRAESKIGSRGYNLLSYNCEHFATECRYGVARSSQVENIGGCIKQ